MCCANKPPGDVDAGGGRLLRPHMWASPLWMLPRATAQGPSPPPTPVHTVLTFPAFLTISTTPGPGLHLGSWLIPRGRGMLSSPPEGRCWAPAGGVACHYHLATSSRLTSTCPPQSYLFLRLPSPQRPPFFLLIGAHTPEEKAGVMAAERTPA